MKNKLIILITCLSLLLSTSLIAQDNPEAVINSTVDSLVAAVENNSDLDQRRIAMKNIIEPNFNFPEMAKRSLGSYWPRCTKEEQEEFKTVFSQVLAETYLNKIATIEKGMVEIKSTQVKAPKALVKTIVNYKGETFPLDYRMLNRDGSWKVYDVVIENIGLVSNYRNEFAGIIRKKKFAGLMEMLRKKIS